MPVGSRDGDASGAGFVIAISERRAVAMTFEFESATGATVETTGPGVFFWRPDIKVLRF